MSFVTNPVAEVRRSCQIVADRAKHVHIDAKAVQSEAAAIAQKLTEGGGTDCGVEWDSSGWHYCADSKQAGPLTAQYVLVLDALNFCFWPHAEFEYDTLAVALKDVLTADAHAFDADRLIEMDEVCMYS